MTTTDQSRRAALFSVAAVGCWVVPVRAQTGPTSVPATPFRVGVDYYAGATNQAGGRRFSDGYWAGSGAAFPSVGYVGWDNEKGQAARVSVGLGELYTGPNRTVTQPVEAWYRWAPGRDIRLTVGKFWVPFAAQEWQYETKPGAMVSWARGPYNLALSLNRNETTRGLNGYLRAGRVWGETGGLGVSLATGRGLSYNSVHDRGWGVDATVALGGGFRVSAEYEALRAAGGGGADPSANAAFRFGYAKLAYENGGRWLPFVAHYDWRDRAGELGALRSTVYGLGYQITPGLTLEGAFAPTSAARTVSWAQLHWTWERR